MVDLEDLVVAVLVQVLVVLQVVQVEQVVEEEERHPVDQSQTVVGCQRLPVPYRDSPVVEDQGMADRRG